MKPSELKRFLLTTVKANLPVLIKGAPGIGKTDIVAQVAQELGFDLIIEHPVVSDPTDFKGMPVVMGDVADFLPFGSLKRLVDADKPTLFFLDDLGQAPMAVQAACMQLILARRIDGHKVSDQVCFVAATNRHSDRAGVSGLLEPVKSRFVSIVELEPNLEDWIAWALFNKLPMELISFVQYRPNFLFDFKPTHELINSSSPRTVHNVAKLMWAGTSQDLEYEAFTGAAGEGFAVEYMGFLKTFRNLPDLETILANPENAVVSKDVSVLYATCGALIARADESNIEQIVRYGNRLNHDFSVFLVFSCVQKDMSLLSNSAVIDWASRHPDVLIPQIA